MNEKSFFFKYSLKCIFKLERGSRAIEIEWEVIKIKVDREDLRAFFDIYLEEIELTSSHQTRIKKQQVRFDKIQPRPSFTLSRCLLLCLPLNWPSYHLARNSDKIKSSSSSFAFSIIHLKRFSFKKEVNDSIKQRENIDCRNSIVSCISDLFLKGSLGSSFYDSVACKSTRKKKKAKKKLRKFKSHE